MIGLPWWTVVVAVAVLVVPARSPRLGLVVGGAIVVAGLAVLAAAGGFAPHWLSYERWRGTQLVVYGALWVAAALAAIYLRPRSAAIPRATLRR